MKKGATAFIQLLPVILSAFLMAAHFLRTGNTVLVIISLLLPLVLLIRRPWSARIMQGVLVLATIEWIRTLFELSAFRAERGLSWTRLAIILGTVACFTLASALVFHTKTLRERYRLTKQP
ncbi:MAG: hypothetical protein ACE5DP_04445 [Fidelibacterota bacterium]